MEIPLQIQELIAKGLWKAKAECKLERRLQEQFGWLEEIILNEPTNKGLLTLTSHPEDKINFGVYSTGEFIDVEKKDHLDVEKCLMLSCNYADESICLDYRFSKNTPRVMASDYSNDNGRWVEIVSSIEELIEGLEIESLNY